MPLSGCARALAGPPLERERRNLFNGSRFFFLLIHSLLFRVGNRSISRTLTLNKICSAECPGHLVTKILLPKGESGLSVEWAPTGLALSVTSEVLILNRGPRAAEDELVR